MSFTIRVVDEDDNPVCGARVRISFTSILRGMSDDERTDSDGEVEFDDYEDGEIEVFVDGESQGTHYYEDGETITISV